MSQSELRVLQPDWHRKPIKWKTGGPTTEVYEAILQAMPPAWLYTEAYTPDMLIFNRTGRERVIAMPEPTLPYVQ